MLRRSDTEVRVLGECTFDNPHQEMVKEGKPLHGDVDEDDRILCFDTLSGLQEVKDFANAPSFEPAGPRSKLFFDPASTRAGIVTCGGLCPGLNDVIRGLVMILWHRYGVREIFGFRNGYAGLNPKVGRNPMVLEPSVVRRIHDLGGTILGSSRGPQDPKIMIDYLRELGVNVLFAIGGDGTLRGACSISEEARRQNYPLAVIGVPKTIDNDIMYVERSFGFETAFGTAVEAIRAGNIEAEGAENGVGLIKVMGRHSGFVAAYAALANNDVNFVLIPEVEFPLEGPGGFLEHLETRLRTRSHAVVVVGEGAGQRHMESSGETDASGNKKLGDIGRFLQKRIGAHLTSVGMEHTIKYIDPSYMVRSVKANPGDSVYCFRLAAFAVHAAMAGRTEMLVATYHGRFVHVPIPLAVDQRKCISPRGDLWRAVMEATGQPEWL